MTLGDWDTDSVVDGMIDDWVVDMEKGPDPVVVEFNRQLDALVSLASVTYAVAWSDTGGLLKGWIGDPPINDIGCAVPWGEGGSFWTQDQKAEFIVQMKGENWAEDGWRLSNPNGTDPQPREGQSDCVLCGSEGQFPLCGTCNPPKSL